jgi:hypothetical protein
LVAQLLKGMTRVRSDRCRRTCSASIAWQRRATARKAKFLVGLADTPERNGDSFLGVAHRDPEPRGDLRRRELIEVAQAEHLSIGGMNSLKNAAHGQHAIDMLDVDSRAQFGHAVERRVINEIDSCTAAAIGATGVRDRGNEPGARVFDARTGKQKRVDRIVDQRFGVPCRYAKLAAGHEEQNGTAIQIERADIGRRLVC